MENIKLVYDFVMRSAYGYEIKLDYRKGNSIFWKLE